MKIYKEESLQDFEFWGGAESFAEKLTGDELDTIEMTLEYLSPDGMDETQLNDLFRFSREWMCELIGTTEAEVWDRE